jgi:cell division protein FtsW
MRRTSSFNGFLLPVLSLIGFGLVQVYSASYMYAAETQKDPLFFFKKQCLFVVAALVALVVVSRFSVSFLRRWGWVFWALSSVALVLTFVPHIGARVGGAQRWIDLPWGLRFEPSEFLKVSLPLLLASLVNLDESSLERWHWTLILTLLAVPVGLLLVQPDFGSFALIAAVLFGFLLLSGLRWKFVGLTLLMIIPALYFLVMEVDYRRARVAAFLDPWSDPEQKGFQVIQSMLTFSNGGLFGTGLGEGQGKLFFLPEAHTDFTLAVFGEENGFIGFVILMFTFGLIIYRGLRLSWRSEDKFNRTLVFGLSLLFALNVLLNVGVALGFLPTKGLTLPFLSYGGSSLVSMSVLVGLLMNIERQESQR